MRLSGSSPRWAKGWPASCRVTGWAPRPDLAGRGSPGGWHGSQLGLAGRNRGRTDPACFGTLRRNVRSRCLRNEGRWQILLRSEEHTSELQSLMRNSYAVFCLKKKTKNKTSQHRYGITKSRNTHRLKSLKNNMTKITD